MGVLADEVEILAERLDSESAQRMIRDRATLSSIPNQATSARNTKSAFTAYKDMIKGLLGKNGKVG